MKKIQCVNYINLYFTSLFLITTAYGIIKIEDFNLDNILIDLKKSYDL